MYLYIFFFFSPFDSRIYCDPTAFDGTFNMREYTTLAIFHWLKRLYKQYAAISYYVSFSNVLKTFII